LTGGNYFDVIVYIMDYKQIAEDTKYSVRTQISLSRSLYEAVKTKAKNRGQSMSEVTRKALLNDLEEKEKSGLARKKRLTQWVRRTRGMSKGKGGWGNVGEAHKTIRKWREDDDEALAKRLGWDE